MASPQLSRSGKAPGPSRPGTKCPVRGNPSLRRQVQIIHRSEGFPNGIFAPCAWCSRGLTRWAELLGRRRRRRQLSFGKFNSADGKFDGVDGKFDGVVGTFDSVDGKPKIYVVGKFDGVVGKFDGFDGKSNISRFTIESEWLVFQYFQVHNWMEWLVSQYFQVQNWIKEICFPIFTCSKLNQNNTFSNVFIIPMYSDGISK